VSYFFASLFFASLLALVNRIFTWVVRRFSFHFLLATGGRIFAGSFRFSWHFKRNAMRVCFLLKVRPEKIEEYKARHAQVSPEMLAALRQTGWRNYSLFLRPDGIVVGYCETDDFDQCRAAMKHYPVNQRWQTEMAPLFDSLDGDSADDAMFPLEEVFHLD
jgi:L-rhamnose mutarotase